MMLAHDNPDVRGKVRTFTLSSSPTEDMIMITTKRGPSSFKKALFDLQVGSVIDARDPSGLFTFGPREAGPVLFIAGGIGITPYRSMIRYALDTNLQHRMTLLYAAQTPDDFVFRQELLAWEKNLSHLSVLYTVTKPDSSQSTWTGRVGRIDEPHLKNYIKNNSPALYYISGPGNMVDAMISTLVRIGVASETMLFEKFSGYTED
jgi:ferredoxin-NADP reductase